MQKITVCNKICKECAFNHGGTENTLYYETLQMVECGILFPCHMELKKVTGDMSYGVEQLEEVKVCRGYVAFMAKNFPFYPVTKWGHSEIWINLMAEIDDNELEEIYTMEELFERHEALRNGVKLGNNEGLI